MKIPYDVDEMYIGLESTLSRLLDVAGDSSITLNPNSFKVLVATVLYLLEKAKKDEQA